MPRPRLNQPRPRLVRRGKTGVWQITYTEPGRGRSRRLSTGTTDERTAQRALARFLNALTDNEERKTDGIQTIDEICAAYLKEREGKVIVSALEYALKPIRAHWGAYIPDRLTDAEVSIYRALRSRAGRKNGTIRKELTTLISALKLAHRRGWIKAIPEITLPPVAMPREKWITRAQAEKLLEESRKEPVRDDKGRLQKSERTDGVPHTYLFIMFCITTLARAGAILDLTWDRVDMDSRLIDFRNPDMPETNKRRAVVPINDRLLDALKIAREIALSDHVIEYAGRPVKSVKKSFARIAAAAGMPEVTPHVLRHSGATWLAMDGVSIYEIARLMGHADIQTTYHTYSKYQPDFLRDAVSKLG